MSEGLKPCPFCGQTERLHKGDTGYGITVYCECRNSTRTYHSEEQAIAAWNRRAGIAVPRELLEWALMFVHSFIDGYNYEKERDSYELDKKMLEQAEALLKEDFNVVQKENL